MQRIFGAATLLTAAIASTASAAVVITEVHYNPSGSEGAGQEWIEIFNTGNAAVDLSGWDYGDSQDETYTGDFPAGTTLAPLTAAVVVFQSQATFQSFWGPGIQVIQTDVGISLANGASATNEAVVIRDANDVVIDSVNYENNLNDWPDDNNRSSIYLLPNAVDPDLNDVGSNWALSAAGVHGAYDAYDYNPEIANQTIFETASPGYVEYVPAVPEPASLGLVGLAALAGLRRRRA